MRRARPTGVRVAWLGMLHIMHDMPLPIKLLVRGLCQGLTRAFDHSGLTFSVMQAGG